ncbi:MAG: rhodanese-like domain-containing protein [Methylobacteriaceae bacterium]|nr:rhodanese-like domain-containing protein [Methylobacteriaceae bacterium]
MPDIVADRDLSLDELKRGLDDGSLLVVDVREAHEYNVGHIPGAVLMPLSSFDPHDLPREAGKEIVFSCQSGKRSLTALRRAREAGCDDLAGHFGAGFAGWRSAGEEVSFD